MPILPRIAELQPQMVAWRHDLHAHPETAFQENRTADLVARELAASGIAVHRGLGGTGVVGTLRAGTADRAIGLRADMDALRIEERHGPEHRSRHPGVMHACGHDGHTAMLLGAARYLSESRSFDGIVHFIFQPAEENEGGARAMLEDGLLQRFPMTAVYALHNRPGLPVGHFALPAGPVMAANDRFEVVVTGRGGHVARPDRSADTITAAAQIAASLQALAARLVHPLEPLLLAVTQIQGGSEWNVIPDRVVLRGTARYFRPELGAKVAKGIGELVEHIAASHGAEASLGYLPGYPPVVNHAAASAFAARVAAGVVGADMVETTYPGTMASEDFAFLLQAVPGAYALVGNGAGPPVHTPGYDFNDELLPVGASYLARLAEEALPAGAPAQP